MNRRLKHFVQYGKRGDIISSGNILSNFKPRTGRWVETPTSVCCQEEEPILTTTTTTIPEFRIISPLTFDFENGEYPIHQVVAYKNGLTTTGETPNGEFTITTDVANVNPVMYYFVIYGLILKDPGPGAWRTGPAEEIGVLIGEDTTELLISFPYMSAYVFRGTTPGVYTHYYKNIFGKGSWDIVTGPAENYNLLTLGEPAEIGGLGYPEAINGDPLIINKLEGVVFSFIDGDNDNDLFFIYPDTGEIGASSNPVDPDSNNDGIYNIDVLATLGLETAIAVQQGILIT